MIPIDSGGDFLIYINTLTYPGSKKFGARTHKTCTKPHFLGAGTQKFGDRSQEFGGDALTATLRPTSLQHEAPGSVWIRATGHLGAF